MVDTETLSEEVNRPPKRKLGPGLMGDDEENALAKRLFGVSGEADSSDEDVDSDDDNTEIAELTASVSTKSVWKDDDDFDDEEIDLPKKKTAVFLKKSTDVETKLQKQEYQQRLRAHFVRTHNGGKIPNWAKTDKQPLSGARGDDSDDEVDAALKMMTRTTGNYVVKSELLPKSVIQTNVTPDITVGHFDGKPISALRFHRAKPVILTADGGGTVKLFQVDNEVKKEHFLQKMKMKRFPISSMDFSGGDAVICGAMNQEYMMRYNFVTGDVTQLRLPFSVQRQAAGHFVISTDGSTIAMVGFSNQVHLLSASSMEHIQSVSVSSPVASVSFLPGSNTELCILTENGQVNCWQGRASSLHSFIDDGAIRGTKIVFSPDGSYLACGSNSGIVNVYETADAKRSAEPKPFMSVKALLTSCDSIAFNNDSQALAVGSSIKKNHVKIAHLRSKTVFSNFPQHFEKIPNATCLEFSPHSGYFAVGTQNGRLRMYRVEHFSDY